VSAANAKAAARELVDRLPDSATWDDIVYEMVARREIERGIADSEAGRTTSIEKVLEEFGISG